MKIFKSKPGEIGPDSYWIVFHECWMYVGDTLLKLFWVMISEWKHDRRLVG